MCRSFAAIFALIVPAFLAAADKPDPASVPRVVTARIERDYLIWSEFKEYPSVREVDITVQVNGKPMVQRMTVSMPEISIVHRATALKKLKFSDGSGKAISVEKLGNRLAEEAPVVFHTGPLAAKYKPLFAAEAILVEFEAPATTVPAKP
jgi:hypothetical protein